MAIKKARKWSEKMFRSISHEALIGAFMGLVCMLAFHEAGLFGIITALVIGVFGGFLKQPLWNPYRCTVYCILCIWLDRNDTYLSLCTGNIKIIRAICDVEHVALT
ncbi:MAG: hypothetical protein V8R46_04910 [Eubacterium ramulus]